MKESFDHPPDTEEAVERRSARYEQSGRKRPRDGGPRRGGSGRTIVAALAAVIVVAAVGVVSSPLAHDWWPASTAETTGSTVASAGSTTSSTVGAHALGSGLVVVTQEGAPVVVALFAKGPDRGEVLGLPAITLLRAGDRFVRLVDVYAAGGPSEVAQPLVATLGLPAAAASSLEWADLRAALAGAAGGAKLPEKLDPRGADAGVVAAVLAAAISGGQRAFAQGFEDVIAAEGTNGWAGQALSGALVEYGAEAVYFEPDMDAARGIFAGTSARAVAGG